MSDDAVRYAFEVPDARAERQFTSEAVIAVLLLVTLWLLTRPYFGIINDSRFYMVQGLALLHPGAYADDLFFKYGSQSSFSIIGSLLALGLAHFSPATVHFSLTVIGDALWAAAAWMFAAAICSPGREKWLALAALFILPSDYAAGGIFHYGEPFFTPRQYAEAMTMISLAAFLTDRWLLAGASMLVALIAHPIAPVPGVMLVFFLLATRDARWWWAVVIGVVLGAGLCMLGVEPFVRAREIMAGDWLTEVMTRSGWAFFATWSAMDYFRVVVQALIIGVAFTFLSKDERRLYAALGSVFVVSSLATVIGADLAHNLLAINLQPVRFMWLASAMVNLIAGAALYRVFAAQHPCRWHFAAAVVIYIASVFLNYLLILAILPLLIALWLVRRGSDESIWARRMRFVATTTAVEVAVAGTILSLNTIAKKPDGVFIVIMVGGLILTMIASLALYRGNRSVALVLSVIACATAVGIADRREGWERVIEASNPLVVPEKLLGNARNVYWEDGIDFMWMKLERASYFSCHQGSGAMFYRGTSAEYFRRANVLSQLNTLDFVNTPLTICPIKAAPFSVGPADATDIINACERLPNLDMMVLLSDEASLNPPSWKAPAPRYRQMKDGTYDAVDHYYFYDCRKLRRAGPTID